jgi:tetratricopeptide (TPR) repeat protein
MHSPIARLTELPRLPLAGLGRSIAIVVAPRLGEVAAGALAATGTGPAAAARPSIAAVGDVDDAVGAIDPLAPPVAGRGSDEIPRIRANVVFWGDRLEANERDFVSATRLAASFIDLARATGDMSAYLAADEAVGTALRSAPTSLAARDYQAVILVALHRFVEARDHAERIVRDAPSDATALATLGDAALETGDLDTATSAYARLQRIGDDAAAAVRLARLAFVEGRTDDAVAEARTGRDRAIDEGASGSALAWYEYQYGEMLLATGDDVGALAAFDRALTEDPNSHLALSGRARIAASDGRIDAAIADLDQSLAMVPLPEDLARRADLLEVRGAPGDWRRAADDRATILAIGRLSGEAAGVYDRTLSLYLATTGIDPAEAVRLAKDEIEVRRDAYGYDALGWALLADGRVAEADEAMRTALATGLHDARVLYHAGMTAARVGDGSRARALLEDAMDLRLALDPVAVDRISDTLRALR